MNRADSERAPASASDVGSARGGHTLWPSEALVGDVVGRLIEFWGFKRNMGRVWTVLYLSPEPMSAEDLRHSLMLSSGAVSMTLGELSRWGVVRKVWVQGERKDFYTAEVQLWKMISRVYSEREKAEIGSAIEAFTEALRSLDAIEASDAATKARVALQRERIGNLLELAKLGRQLLDVLLSTARLDAEPLVKFLLGDKKKD
ncbi:MAG: ArsR family transcriptional regulator [Myxococcales bacterium]|nr:ArsR family transcriptional regulator [Myxococcales bacterium]